MKKKLSTHAQTAKLIREVLRKEFNFTVFCVRSSVFAGGNSVQVEWTNGPSYDQVMKVIGKYQYGHFDGMTDCYDHSNCRDDIPQVKYVQVRREISRDLKEILFDIMRKKYEGWQHLRDLDQCCSSLMEKWRAWSANEYIHRMIASRDLRNINVNELIA